MAVSLGNLYSRITTGAGLTNVGAPLNNTQGDANLSALVAAFALAAPNDSPTLTGTPSAPTPALGDNDTSIATTSFVQGTKGGSSISLTGLSGAGATFTLTTAQYSVDVIKLTGTLSANIIIRIPDSVTREWTVVNGTSGSFTINFKTVSGATNIDIPAAGIKIIYADGTNVIDLFPTQTPSDNTTKVATTEFVQTIAALKTPQTSTVGSAVVPTGSTSQRDLTPIAGYLRYNSDISQFEGYSGTAWGAVGGGATGGVNNPTFYENDVVVLQNYTIGSGAFISGITVTIASPAIFTLPAHGLVAGSTVMLKSTGSLPTGLAANVQYFVIAAGLTTNAFELALAAGGTAINTSGTQSGVHSVGKIKNAMTTGPISILSGISVTIPTGSNWVIL